MICHIFQWVHCHIYTMHIIICNTIPVLIWRRNGRGAKTQGRSVIFPRSIQSFQVPSVICTLKLRHCKRSWRRIEKIAKPLLRWWLKKWKQDFGCSCWFLLEVEGDCESICHWVREWVDLWPARKPNCCRIKQDISVTVTGYYFLSELQHAVPWLFCFVWHFAGEKAPMWE